MNRLRPAAFALFVSALVGAGCTDDPFVAPPDALPDGTLHVHVSTLGSVIDEDGFWFRARDTTDFVQPNDDFTVPGLESGPIEVELGGLATNCAYASDSLLSLSIAPEATTLAEFAVTCEAPNVILVAVLRLTGPEPDPDGFTLWLDGEDVERRLSFDGDDVGMSVRPGTHTIELRDTRSNCVVEGDNPRTVFVPQRTFVNLEIFEVECVDAPGALDVSVATSGRDLDTDGYDVTIDGTVAADLPPDGSTVVDPLPSDSAQLRLDGVAPNCGVLGGPSRVVRIPAIDTLRVELEVVCGAGAALLYEAEQRAVLEGEAPLLGSEWTIELWLRLEAGSERMEILRQDGVLQLDAGSEPGDAVGRIGFIISTESVSTASGTGCEPVLGEWAHFGATYDGGLLRFYLDGALCRPGFTTGTTTAAAPGNPLILGDNSPFDPLPDGVRALDEVRVWSEARTADELIVHRDQLVDPTDPALLAYWRFDAGSGQRVSDQTGGFGDFVLGADDTTVDADPTWIGPGRP